MEGASSSALPLESKPKPAGGASQYLTGLPSRGLFSSTVFSSNPGGMRVYICDRDTSPPEEQIIKTNATNILIRSLTLKKQKGDCSSKDGRAPAESGKKRTADKVSEGRTSSKRPMTNAQTNTRQDGAKPERDFHSLTVEKLRALLKDRGLSLKGRKDDLIARLKGADS